METKRVLYILVLCLCSCSSSRIKNCNSVPNTDFKILKKQIVLEVSKYYSSDENQDLFKKYVSSSCINDSLMVVRTKTRYGMVGEFSFNLKGELLDTEHFLPEVY